jgi:hypothetical protein
MARKTKIVVVDRPGSRDNGKRFLLTEMSAAAAERWAARAFLALAKAGVEVDDDMHGAGMAAIAATGLRALGRLDWQDAEPLLDEMMTCVKFCPDPAHPEVVRPIMTDDDVEEVETRFLLRMEVLQLHVNFSLAGALSAAAPQTSAVSMGSA